MGYCIAEWSNVEEELFRICWQCLGSGVRQAAVVYYKTPSLEARLLLVDELIESLFPPRRSGAHHPPAYKKWTEIRSELETLKPIRNRLAHHPVTPWDLEVVADDMEPINLAWHEIQTGYWERLRPKTKPYEPITVEDLIAHRPAVQSLAVKLLNFRMVTLPVHAPVPPVEATHDP